MTVLMWIVAICSGVMLFLPGALALNNSDAQRRAASICFIWSLDNDIRIVSLNCFVRSSGGLIRFVGGPHHSAVDCDLGMLLCETIHAEDREIRLAPSVLAAD